MREIKFRTWNPDWEEVIYSNLETIFGKREFYPLSFEVGFSHYPTEGWTIMQYTGLKDKNGKEIYEGDIVIPQTLTDSMYRVYWSQERLQWSIINVSNVSKESGRALINNNLLYKVIGNIYENPELLEDENA